MLDTSTLISELTSFFSDVDPVSTPATKAIKLATIIETYVKTGSIATGTLSSTGTGNLGAPVVSLNTTTGMIE